MESASLTTAAAALLPRRPPSSGRKLSRKLGLRSRHPATSIFAARREAHDQSYDGGRLVDENLIVLRKRIHEVKMSEGEYMAPGHWMGWEKRWYNSCAYDAAICEAVGVLQFGLMNLRPSWTLGLVALFGLSALVSAAALVLQLLAMSKVLPAGIHLMI